MRSQGGNAGVAIQPKTLAYAVVGADEIGIEPDADRYPLAGGVFVPAERQALHVANVVAVALAFERPVVEVGGG